jgi:predicted  nucleic acid-binding Zn-ribbon protein
MAQEIELALRLQRMDRQLAQLEAEIRGLPKKIAELEKQLEGHERKLEADRAALAANQMELRRLNGVMEDNRSKIAKLKKQIMQATTPEQLAAFQHEIAFCEQQIERSEADSMRALEEAGVLGEKVAKAEAALEAERRKVAEQKAEARRVSEEDRKKGVRIYRERQQLAKEVPAKLLEQYERIRKRYKDGIVVAECTDGNCSSCMMTIRPALLQQIRQERGRLFLCESCQRMLHYNPPQLA